MSGFMRFCMVLISAGAVGNGIDRAFNGYVVDFLKFEFVNFAIFNLADVFIVSGTILLAVLILFFYKENNDYKNK